MKTYENLLADYSNARHMAVTSQRKADRLAASGSLSDDVRRLRNRASYFRQQEADALEALLERNAVISSVNAATLAALDAGRGKLHMTIR